MSMCSHVDRVVRLLQQMRVALHLVCKCNSEFGRQMQCCFQEGIIFASQHCMKPELVPTLIIA
jgi:hypothetical protein